MAQPKKFTAEFDFVNETKRKIRFGEDNDTPKIGTVYITKKEVKELGEPTRIRVTVEALS